MCRWHLAMAGLMLLACNIPRTSLAAVPRYRVEILAEPPEEHWVTPRAMNDRGQVAGDWRVLDPSYHLRAVFYDGSQFHELVSLRGTWSNAWAVNNRGQVVGRGGNNEPFLYDETGIHLLPLTAWGINDAGDIVGDLKGHAAIYRNGVIQNIETVGVGASYAYDINNRGQAAGYLVPLGDNQTNAFFYDGSQMRDLGSLGGYQCQASALNDRGEVVGYYAAIRKGSRVEHAFLYDSTGMRDIGPGRATGINNLGQVVGYSGQAPFLYQDGVIYSLAHLIPPDSGWSLGSTLAINDLGQIAIQARRVDTSDEERHLLLLTPLGPDTTPPTTRASLSPPPNAAGWINSASDVDVTVSLSATDDDGFSARTITFRTVGAQTIPSTTDLTSSLGATDFAISAEGQTSVTFFATDDSGNIEAAKSIAVNIDRTPPTTSAVSAPPPGKGGASIGPVAVTLSAADTPGGSGIETITYAATGAQTIPPTTISGSTALVRITTPGQTTLTYFATDRAGNADAEHRVTVSLVIPDHTPPTSTLVLSSAPNEDGLYHGDVTLTLGATDNDDGAGVEAITYTATGAQSIPRTTVSGPGPVQITLTTTGSTTIRFSARDNAGNSEPFKSITLRIDKSGAPSTSTGSLAPFAVTYDSLCALAHQFAAKPSVADGLCGKLEAARAADARGARKRKSQAIASFVNLVKKRRGRYLNRDQADLLIRLARGL